jgi:hypothetical protein
MVHWFSPLTGFETFSIKTGLAVERGFTRHFPDSFGSFEWIFPARNRSRVLYTVQSNWNFL